MNNLDKKLLELEELNKQYDDGYWKALDNISKIDLELKELSQREDNLKQLSSFKTYKKGNKVDLLKKIKILKLICDIIALVSIGVVFGGVVSLGSIISVLTGSTVVPNTIGTYLGSLIMSICVVPIGLYVLKKVETRHNLYCDKYYLNDELFDDSIYDIDRINEDLCDIKEEKETLQSQLREIFKKNEEQYEKQKQLKESLKRLTQYRDSLDDLINEIYQKNMPQELKESIQASFVKVKHDERNKF